MFVPEELQEAWGKVADPNCAYYPDAVQQLVQNKDQLPAPFVLQMDFIGKVTDPHWRSVVEASKPLCKCGIKRCVLPDQRCMPFVSAQEIQLLPGHYLQIAPWGGDQRSTMVRLGVMSDGTSLRVEWLPYVHGSDLAFFGFLHLNADGMVPLDELGKMIAEGQQLPIGYELTADELDTVPVCRLIGVRKGVVTVQLHAGAMQPKQREFHWCT